MTAAICVWLRAAVAAGLYSNLQKYNLPYAEAVFDIDYFKRHPTPFYTLCREMWPGNYAPTPAHRFFAELHRRGKLLRCFTQNIDSLESEAGLPQEMIVAAHGNFDSAQVRTHTPYSTIHTPGYACG
jgi:NAD-dependent SIR2 family protein deacetylase